MLVFQPSLFESMFHPRVVPAGSLFPDSLGIPSRCSRQGTCPPRRQQKTSKPLLKICRGEDGVVIKVHLPNHAQENIRVQVEGKSLSIFYHKKQKYLVNGLYLVEKDIKTLKRSFELSDRVNVDAITARYDADILIVTVPYKKQTGPRVIPVQVTAPAPASVVATPVAAPAVAASTDTVVTAKKVVAPTPAAKSKSPSLPARRTKPAVAVPASPTAVEPVLQQVEPEEEPKPAPPSPTDQEIEITFITHDSDDDASDDEDAILEALEKEALAREARRDAKGKRNLTDEELMQLRKEEQRRREEEEDGSVEDCPL